MTAPTAAPAAEAQSAAPQTSTATTHTATTAVVVDADGFPSGTPLDQMTVDQREAYWKYQSRKHEQRVKALGDLTPEALQALQAKAEAHDALEFELGSEADKKAATARKEALAESDAKWLPQLVQARLEAAAAGKVEPDSLAKALEFTDMSKFVADGKVDTAKVASFVDSISTAPAKGTQQQRGPSPSGLGNRAPVTAQPGDAGRARALKRGFIKAE